MLEWIVSSAALCALVIGLRYLLRGRIGLRLQYALWALVLLRLLLPVSFGSSRFSIMNVLPEEGELLPPAPTAYSRAEGGGIGRLPAATPAPASPGSLEPAPRTETQPTPFVPKTELPSAEPERTPPDAGRILRILWLAGAGVMLLWFAGVNLRFAGRLRRSRERFFGAEAYPLPVYVTAAAETPCLFGLFRPAVYLPPEAAADPALDHILAHELTHFRHGDQVWSLLRSLALALHWFDPLVWWAAFLSRRDGELACDEGTLRRLGEAERTEYGRTLLRMTCASRPALFRAATTMTGGKRGLRERIRLIAKRPRTAVITLAAVILIAALALGCTFTGAKKPVDYTDEWFAETAWPYAEEYAKANSLSISRENYLVLPRTIPEVEVYFPVENTLLGRTLSVIFTQAEDGTWTVVKGVPVQDILRKGLEVVVEAEVPDAEEGALNCAVSYLLRLAVDWNDGYPPWSGEYTADVNRIVRIRLTGLTPMGTGRAGLTSGDELYRLEYRLLPEDQAHIDLPEGMRTEVIDGDTWITEWSADGQPYLLLRWMVPEGDPEQDGERQTVWTLAGVTNTRELEEVYGSPEMVEKYGDAYTAAAAELYAAYLAGENAPSVRLNREDFILQNPGDSFLLTLEIPPALRNATVSWFSMDPNVATVSKDGLVTAVNHGSTKIDVWVGSTKAQCTVRVMGYAAEPADPEDPAGWLDELGGVDFIVSTDGSYAEIGRLWAEAFASRYTRLSPENPLYSRRAVVRTCSLEAETLLSDPKVLAFHVVWSFDAPDPEGFTRCYAGTAGPLGETDSDPAYGEWVTMEQIVFLREIPDGGWGCRSLASGGGYGWGWLCRNEAVIAGTMAEELSLLIRGEAWSPEVLLMSLPFEDWSTFEQRHGAYALEALLWALRESCLTVSRERNSADDLVRRLQDYPEDQSYRDLYVMLGTLNASGGIAEDLGRILALQRFAAPERFDACLKLLKAEDRTRLLGLAEAALALRPEEAAVLEALTALEAERVDTVVCKECAGTGTGISFTLNRAEYGKEIEGLLGMFPRDLGEYTPQAINPEWFGQMTDFSLTFLDAGGNEIVTVDESGMQMIRIGSCVFRCRDLLDTQAFSLALAAARDAGLLRYPETETVD